MQVIYKLNYQLNLKTTVGRILQIYKNLGRVLKYTLGCILNQKKKLRKRKEENAEWASNHKQMLYTTMG